MCGKGTAIEKSKEEAKASASNYKAIFKTQFNDWGDKVRRSHARGYRTCQEAVHHINRA